MTTLKVLPVSSLPTLAPRDWSSHPQYIYPGYKSTLNRGPQQPLIPLKASLGELRQPVYGHGSIGEFDHDLTRNARKNGEPLGERMILTGQVLDERRRPVRNTLIELWQANASGRSLQKIAAEIAHLRSATIDLFESFTPEMLIRKGTANKNELSVIALGFIIAGHETHHCNILKERYIS